MNITNDFVGTDLVLSGLYAAVGNLASLSILGAHLLFNMKEAGAKGLNQGTSCSSRATMSNIDFATPPPAATSQSTYDMVDTEIAEVDESC